MCGCSCVLLRASVVRKMDTVGSRVIPLTDEGDLWQRHFASAEMVIEAVPENLDLKHRCEACLSTVAPRAQQSCCSFFCRGFGDGVVFFVVCARPAAVDVSPKTESNRAA